MSSSDNSQNNDDDSKSKKRRWWPDWCCSPALCTGLCLAFLAVVLIAVVVTLASIPLYNKKKHSSTAEQGGSVQFRLVYNVNVSNVTDLMITNKMDLANKLMEKFNLQEITIIDTQLISSTLNSTIEQQLSQYNINQCATGINTTKSVLVILFSIQYPSKCYSATCKQQFVDDINNRITKLNNTIALPLTFTNGNTLNADMNLCALTQTKSSMTNISTATIASRAENATAMGNTTATRNKTGTRTTSRTRTRNTTVRRNTTGTRTTSRTRTRNTTARRTTTGTTTTDNPCLSTCAVGQVCIRGMCTTVGTFSASLIWSRPGDGDIVLTLPDNKSIYWGNKGPSANTDGGVLDRDDQIGRGPETIYWSSTSPDPPAGTYNVCFQLYSFNPPPSIQKPVVATITIRRSTGVIDTFKKTVTEKYTFNSTCFPSSNGYLGSFNYL